MVSVQSFQSFENNKRNGNDNRNHDDDDTTETDVLTTSVLQLQGVDMVVAIRH